MNNDVPEIDDIYIDGDKQKLGQVMRNLISNALKFTPSGGTVTVRAVSLTKVSEPSAQYPRRSLKSLLSRGSSVVSHGGDSDASNAKHNPTPLWLKIQVVDTGAGISKVATAALSLTQWTYS